MSDARIRVAALMSLRFAFLFSPRLLMLIAFAGFRLFAAFRHADTPRAFVKIDRCAAMLAAALSAAAYAISYAGMPLFHAFTLLMPFRFRLLSPAIALRFRRHFSSPPSFSAIRRRRLRSC